jgi:hypothetical protein
MMWCLTLCCCLAFSSLMLLLLQCLCTSCSQLYDHRVTACCGDSPYAAALRAHLLLLQCLCSSCSQLYDHQAKGCPMCRRPVEMLLPVYS